MHLLIEGMPLKNPCKLPFLFSRLSFSMADVYHIHRYVPHNDREVDGNRRNQEPTNKLIHITESILNNQITNKEALSVRLSELRTVGQVALSGDASTATVFFHFNIIFWHSKIKCYQGIGLRRLGRHGWDVQLLSFSFL